MLAGCDENDGCGACLAWRGPEFWMLVVTALLGVARGPAWVVIPIATAYLSISSMPKYVALWASAREAAATHASWAKVGSSIVNTGVAASFAYLVGRLVVRIWG